MNGRYLILTPASLPNEKHFDAAWHKFAEVCRSPHRDGLDYHVQLNLHDVRPHLLITASGTAKPQRKPAKRGLTLPQPILPKRCRDRAMEAEWFLPENSDRRKDGTAYWNPHQARYQELSAMAEEFIWADAEVWRELEFLSGQRQHFKPGLTDETRTSDDEVAA